MKEQFVEEYLQYGVRLHKDIVFGNADGTALKLDLLVSREPRREPSPVIVWVHGGGWCNHDLDRNYRPELELLRYVSRGYIVASIDYRLSDQAPFPAQIQDCKCAIRYLRANAEKWNLDPDRIGVWGESAGGHLVDLLGAAEDVPEFEGNGGWQGYSSRVSAVCTWYSPADLTGTAIAQDDGTVNLLVGNPAPDKLPEALRLASPVTYLHPGMPPFLVMHGNADELVPFAQSEELFRRLQEMGCPAEFYAVDGQGHGFYQGDEPYRVIHDFFDKYLLVR